MGDIERITYKNNTFIIVGEGKAVQLFYKNAHQTLKITWMDAKFPQTTLIRKIADRIRSGEIKNAPELLLACNGKLSAVDVGNWYKEITHVASCDNLQKD